MKISKTWYAMFVLLVLGGLLVGGTLTALGQEETPGNEIVALAPVTPKISVAVRDLPAPVREPMLDREEINPIKNPGLFLDDLGLTGTDTKMQMRDQRIHRAAAVLVRIAQVADQVALLHRPNVVAPAAGAEVAVQGIDVGLGVIDDDQPAVAVHPS